MPPADETRMSEPRPDGENTMMPSRFQVPPRPFRAMHTVWAGPPEASILLSVPAAKKPRYRLSGDQNGNEASSVPASGSARMLLRWRTHRRFFPFGVDA